MKFGSVMACCASSKDHGRPWEWSMKPGSAAWLFKMPGFADHFGTKTLTA
jgi:hypothetical protein